jgi:nucleoside-diphosphate kinase
MMGEIVKKFEQKGLKMVGMKMAKPGKAMFEKHYEDLAGKPFFNGLVEYAASGPVCCMVWEG